MQEPAEAAAAEPGETRSPSEIQRHYEIEKELAERLRNSTRDERRVLYPSLYDELFRRVETHPQLTRKAELTTPVASQLQPVERYLNNETVFLEIGAGDCALAAAVAERTRMVYALEVSQAIIAAAVQRENLEIFVTDGLQVPVSSITLAHSDQVLEHIHPDDALYHMRNVHSALAPNGRYVCLTPNRLVGPTDVSKHFDPVATGFHLREYTVSEVAALMRKAGFARVEAWATRKGRSFRVPLLIIRSVEATLGHLPRARRIRLGRKLPFRVILGCYLVGTKAYPEP